MLQNMGTQDRILRLALGICLIAGTLKGWIGNWGWVGGYPMLTGVYGVCLLYMPFRFNTFTMYVGRGVTDPDGTYESELQMAREDVAPPVNVMGIDPLSANRAPR